jgi:hypothetical protein
MDQMDILLKKMDAVQSMMINIKTDLSDRMSTNADAVADIAAKLTELDRRMTVQDGKVASLEAIGSANNLQHVIVTAQPSPPAHSPPTVTANITQNIATDSNVTAAINPGSMVPDFLSTIPRPHPAATTTGAAANVTAAKLDSPAKAKPGL